MDASDSNSNSRSRTITIDKTSFNSAGKSKKSGAVRQPSRATRFRPDPLTTALLDLKNGAAFNPELVALVVNESYTGCALIVLSDVKMEIGTKLKAKIGILDPLPAEIVWLKTLEENIVKVGLRLLA